jgi:hypothetical protein
MTRDIKESHPWLLWSGKSKRAEITRRAIGKAALTDGASEVIMTSIVRAYQRKDKKHFKPD